jgi:hypothetical protein
MAIVQMNRNKIDITTWRLPTTLKPYHAMALFNVGQIRQMFSTSLIGILRARLTSTRRRPRI